MKSQPNPDFMGQLEAWERVEYQISEDTPKKKTKIVVCGLFRKASGGAKVEGFNRQ
jgi:hypothetical protein